jgi:hypothetical protein
MVLTAHCNIGIHPAYKYNYYGPYDPLIVIFIGRIPMLQGVVRTIIVIFIGRIPMLQGVVRTIIVIFIGRIPMLQGVVRRT